MISSKKLHLNTHNNQMFYWKNFTGFFFVYLPKSKQVKHYTAIKCREEFHDYWSARNRYVGFGGHGVDAKIKRINQFFEKIEGKNYLNLSPVDKTVVFKTDEENAIILKVSSFWSSVEIRRNIFTLLLRCAAVHYTGNFMKSLDSYDLTARSNVQRALLFFLKGNVNPTFKKFRGLTGNNYNDGFCDIFKNECETDLSKYFTR